MTLRFGITAECPGMLGVGVPAPSRIVGQEGQRVLRLKERITELFIELRGPLYRYLVCVGVRSPEAEEIIQETFLRLYRHLYDGGRDDNLRGWLFRVAHNIGINELKRKKYLLGLSYEHWAERDEDDSPEELLLRKEKLIRVHTAIATLSKQQKECLYLRAEGFRYREIAEILEVSISTVVESLRRAIKKLSKESHA